MEIEKHEAKEEFEVERQDAKKKFEALNRKVKEVMKKARRTVIKAKKSQMKSEDDLVMESLKNERNFDHFAPLWWWLAVICTVGPLVSMSIFVGGVWHKSYT